MRPYALVTAVLVASVATLASAQATPPKTPAKAPSKAPPPPPAAAVQLPAGIAGTWDGKSMMGPKDSVVTTSVTVTTADGKGWTIKLPGRDPVPVRILAAGGDSVVSEAGPYNSVLRPGQQVTTRQVSHYKGDKATGTFEAKYASGDVVKGKTSATKRK